MQLRSGVLTRYVMRCFNQGAVYQLKVTVAEAREQFGNEKKKREPSPLESVTRKSVKKYVGLEDVVCTLVNY
jgi:hypothetical protein